MANKFKLEGLDDILNTLNQVGKLPQKCVNTSAKKGANISLRDAKAKAPFETGDLKKGIVLKAEKTTIKGKKVYQVTISNNPVFIKNSKGGKRAFYPASQEYGYFTRDGSYIPGLHYMRNSLENNTEAIEKEMVSVLANEIDKLK